MIGQTVNVSEKFSKRDIVVTDTTSLYPQDILFQFTQDKCALLDLYMEGQQVEVSFNLRGREWTSPQGEVKYFNTLEGWRIEAATANVPAPTPVPPIPEPQGDPIGSPVDDDLPF